ncbi:MAG: Bax inhibitor-1/YccA family protein [Bacteroidetes bacterium]|nr:Bax inhibitor-1/YccA family protein [Bacteroidota bacterium]
MEDRNTPINFSDYTVVDSNTIGTKSIAKNFMANVFLWMFAALAISAACAYWFATTPSLLLSLIDAATGKLNMLGWIVMIAPLGFVLTMSFAFNRLSAALLTAFFIAYAAVTGISLSFILLAYTSGSVIGCFAAASAMFGIMAVLGYTTDKDLTSFGRLMIMGLIGIVIASLINWFIGSERMDYIISIIGVAVFTGLTAYDVQKLKRIGAGIEFDGVAATQTRKLAVMGALNLYLDFINLFLMLLRLFGGKRN